MSEAPDLLTLGESMVSLRSAGLLSAGGTLAMHLAGAESNVAIGVARLGHTTRWAGVVGQDPHGEFILRRLRGEGVGVQCRVDPDRSTGVMFLEQRTADLSRAWYYRRGSAGSALTRDDVDQALGHGARILHLTGITPALSPQAADAWAYAAERARGLGLLLSVDVNYRSKLWSREEARAALRPLAELAQIVIASDDELDLVAPPLPEGVRGVDEAGLAAALLKAGVEDVVVKRGAAGAAVYRTDGVHEALAVPVTSLDTVGAGDAFVAGYLSALLDGGDVSERLERATVAGSFAVSTRGDWEGLPTREELALLVGQTPGTTHR